MFHFCCVLSVFAQTTITPARSPEVIHCLPPSSTKPPSSRVAVVAMLPGSLPAPASDSANAPATARPEARRGTVRRFCSSVPNSQITSHTMLVTAIATATDASAFAISCIASAYATGPASAPPSSEGTFTPRRPSAPRARSSRTGNALVRSRSAACGASSRCANSRAVFCTRRSVSSRSKRLMATRRSSPLRSGCVDHRASRSSIDRIDTTRTLRRAAPPRRSPSTTPCPRGRCTA